jgi:PDZ domain-containing protein
VAPAESPSTIPEPTVPLAAPGIRKRRRWPWVILVLVALAVAVTSRINLDYYALQPGTAQSVQQFITVPADKNHPVSRPVLLTDVEIGRVTALSYLFYKLQSDTALEPVGEVTGGTPPSQLNAQGDLEMSQAEAAAKTAALKKLGYPVTAKAAGAVIFGTFPGTPAYSTLNVGDVITEVNGVATPTALALTHSLARYHSGQTITLTVLKKGTAKPAPVPVTLKTTAVDLGGTRPAHLDLGIEPEDQVDYTYPFPVTIDVTNIGGPSAGLAMTLGVIDALTSGSITGGHTVAATGTIDNLGNVGDVGGVAQKTVAVENAGASIFLVPPPEYAAAMSKDRPGLQVYAVSTLSQALTILAGHGGSVSVTTAGHRTTPAG